MSKKECFQTFGTHTSWVGICSRNLLKIWRKSRRKRRTKGKVDQYMPLFEVPQTLKSMRSLSGQQTFQIYRLQMLLLHTDVTFIEFYVFLLISRKTLNRSDCTQHTYATHSGVKSCAAAPPHYFRDSYHHTRLELVCRYRSSTMHFSKSLRYSTVVEYKFAQSCQKFTKWESSFYTIKTNVCIYHTWQK